MKTQKLIVSVAIVCLLFGASGAAMADDILECDDGIIQGTRQEPLVVEGNILIEGQSCTIKDVEVAGRIEVLNAENITIVSNEVEGRILVEKSRFATIVANGARNIVVKNNELASVAANIATRTIRVNRNGVAFVKQNASLAIVCRGNIRLDSFFNQAEEESCR